MAKTNVKFESEEKPWGNFTNQYAVNKTLCFELKPVGHTQKMLDDNKVFEADEEIADNYKEAKKWFNKLHREFIDTTLNETNFPLEYYEEYHKKYLIWEKNKNKTNKIELDKETKKLRSFVLGRFYEVAKGWRDCYIEASHKEKKEKIHKLDNLELFFKAEVFDFLKYKYPEAIDTDGKSLFSPFNKFSGYFDKFHETRKNFYRDDGTSTAIPTRIVNVNLPIFFCNKIKFEKNYKDKFISIFSENEKNIFDLAYFNHCFTQSGIDTYNDIIASLKSKVNRLRQLNPNINKKDLPFFVSLQKQILGESKKHKTEQSDFVEIIGDQEVFPTLERFIEENRACVPQAEKLFEKFVNSQLEETDDFDISAIYIAGKSLNTISNKWFISWNTVRDLLIGKGQKILPEFISIKKIKVALEKSQNNIETKDLFRDNYEGIYKADKDFYKIFIKIWDKEFKDNVQHYTNEKRNIGIMVQEDKIYKPNKKGKLKNGKLGSIQKEKILDYASSALSVYQMMRYFSLEKGKEREWNPEKLEEDEKGDFYGEFNKYYENVNTWKYFNVFKDYLTKKPYNDQKIKLNFDDKKLLKGFSESKTENSNNGTQYGAYLLRKNSKNGYNYYLGISRNAFLLSNFNSEDNSDLTDYERLNYYQIQTRSIYGTSYHGDYSTDSKNLSEQEMVEKIKKSLKSYTNKVPQFQDIINQHYDKIKDIRQDIDKIVTEHGKVFEYGKITKKQFEEALNCQQGFYLFQIYNKDFSNTKGKKSEGSRENLHTKYFKALMEENQKNFDLGTGEIFLRKASIKPEMDNQRKVNNVKIFRYRRFSKNKILFHLSITQNIGGKKIPSSKGAKIDFIRKFNSSLDSLLINFNVNIIGIDRGEKNLAYYSVINQDGKILEINSFNKIKERDDREPTDYHKKLDEIEKDRDEQRKTWQEMTNIKDMKKGYVSQVVKKICDLTIKYNAIIVFEDLNVGFKRGRFAIEKQIYQNLELALAKKLNYLVFKDAKENEPGHHSKAFQLTPPVSNFQDIGKQCGIMFYVPASYTSAICPVCGFRKNISTSIGILENNKKFIEKFKICYEKERDCFRISYKISDFYKSNSKQSSDEIKLFENIDPQEDFFFYSDVERFKYRRNKNNRAGKTELHDPNEELKELLKSNGIDFRRNSDVSGAITSAEFTNEKFYKPLIYKLSLIMQIRNSISAKNPDGTADETKSRDFIHCPHCHFHSEKNLLGFDKIYLGKDKFEFNGDTNGAYNIARKGSLILKKLNKIKEIRGNIENIGYKELTITQEEWDKFALKK